MKFVTHKKTEPPHRSSSARQHQTDYEVYEALKAATSDDIADARGELDYIYKFPRLHTLYLSYSTQNELWTSSYFFSYSSVDDWRIGYWIVRLIKYKTLTDSVLTVLLYMLCCCCAAQNVSMIICWLFLTSKKTAPTWMGITSMATWLEINDSFGSCFYFLKLKLSTNNRRRLTLLFFGVSIFSKINLLMLVD